MASSCDSVLQTWAQEVLSRIFNLKSQFFAQNFLGPCFTEIGNRSKKDDDSFFLAQSLNLITYSWLDSLLVKMANFSIYHHGNKCTPVKQECKNCRPPHTFTVNFGSKVYTLNTSYSTVRCKCMFVVVHNWKQ